ncbi:expansion isoform X2 [Haemaphysalis longicornis]
MSGIAHKREEIWAAFATVVKAAGHKEPGRDLGNSTSRRSSACHSAMRRASHGADRWTGQRRQAASPAGLWEVERPVRSEPSAESSGEASSEATMISRRKILSRSRDELNVDFTLEEEEDVWYQKEKLFKDHIQEVLNKWGQIDDEIWAKIICMERNRRVAKAYARASVLTINGSNDGFDGYRIGLCGFDNPMRDPRTEELKKQIGHGVKIKMDEAGNIMIKRASKSNVYIKEISGGENNSVSADIIRNNGLLEYDKPVKLFDIKKFQQNVSRELKRAYPDRRHLEAQCLSCVCFVKDSPELLDCSIWVMVINIVALELLKTKLPPPMSKRQSAPNLMSVFDRPPRMAEEDPYSLPGAVPRQQPQLPPQQLHGRESKPPKLPPRDLPRPDYEDVEPINRPPPSNNNRKKSPGLYDDPYYCGFRARVPNFAKRGQEPAPHTASGPIGGGPMPRSHSQNYLSLFQKGPSDRSLYDSAYGSCSTDTHHTPVGGGFSAGSGGSSGDDDYSKIYGRIRGAPSGPVGSSSGYGQLPRQVYVGEWE